MAADVVAADVVAMFDRRDLLEIAGWNAVECWAVIATMMIGA